MSLLDMDAMFLNGFNLRWKMVFSNRCQIVALLILNIWRRN